MTSQSDFVEKTFRAVFAPMRSLIQMSLFVQPKLWRRGKSSAAMIALVRFLSSVDSPVFGKIAFLWKRFFAEIALIGSHSSMPSLVKFECCFVSESFVTLGTPMISLSRVNRSGVVYQISAGFKSGVAVNAPMGSFIWVDELVALK
jgi:hypothetical protein